MKDSKVPVEVYSRVVGYFRPVNQWNKGKKEEFRHRREYKVAVAQMECACEYQGHI